MSAAEQADGEGSAPQTLPHSRPSRVLSIQSHTVHGYVGAKASTFPLELLGFEVDPLHSVQLSNHKGYAKGAKGQVLQGEELQDIIDGLEANGLLEGYTHVLTGYMGTISFLRAIISVIKRLKERNPDLVFFCDPVLGDHGKFYVPVDLMAVYQSEIVPLATVITPNQFEIEQLTGITIKTEEDAWKACEAIHDKGVATVIITSCSLGVPDQVTLLASTKAKACGGQGQAKQARPAYRRYAVDIPWIKGRYSGTGDLMAALLLAWSSRCEDDLGRALELSVATVHAVIRRTFDSINEGKNPHCELRIVQSAPYILNPPLDSKAMRTQERS